MSIQQQFDLIVQNHLDSLPKEYVQQLRNEFITNHVVVMDSLLPDILKTALAAEARYLLAEHGKRRDLVIKQTGNTPRNFNSVARDPIAQNGKLIPAFFESHVIKNFLTTLNNDETVHPIPYEPEEFIINSQQATGDTHGWHWDDYAFALIWIVEAPQPEYGGLLEYVPRVDWDKTDLKNCVQKVLDTHPVNKMSFAADTCYFLKSNTTLHRISPLTGGSRRTVIVFSYASDDDLKSPISHETMEQLFANEKEEKE